MKVIYSALGYGHDAFPFDLKFGDDVLSVRDQDDLKETDSMLVVWGGADINPAYYKHPMHSTTYPGGIRDRLEWSLMTRAAEVGIPIVGVCRGAQMLCALAGGFLIQDVDGHAGNHDIITMDGKVMRVNSIHHQMMAGLENTEHELVAWSSERRSKSYRYRDDKIYEAPDDFKEPEFVYFKKVNGYAIQWHPEMRDADDAATHYVLNYIERKERERKQAVACSC